MLQIVLSCGKWQIERRVQALVELAVRAQHREHRRAHARHDAHVEHDVDAVGELDADLAEGGVERPHAVRHDVHRAALHRAVEELAELCVRLAGRHPVVGRAGLLFCWRADERQVLDARDVVGIAAAEEAAGATLRIERVQHALRDGLLGEAPALVLAPVAPHDRVGLGQGGHLVDPGEQGRVLRGGVRRGHVRDPFGPSRIGAVGRGANGVAFGAGPARAVGPGEGLTTLTARERGGKRPARCS
jgi:hypothetical protein